MRPSAIPGIPACNEPSPGGAAKAPGLLLQVPSPIGLGLLRAPACQVFPVLSLLAIGSIGTADLLVPNAFLMSETPGVLLRQEFGFLELIAKATHRVSVALCSVGGVRCKPDRQSSLA